MQILVTGAGGQVGCEVVPALVAHDVVAKAHSQLDVTDDVAVRDVITTTRPDVVVHTAAWTAVDACESDPARAEHVNTQGTVNVTIAAHEVDARVFYLSTDYVFDGTKDSPYVETDEPNPASVYGRTKLGGELALSDDDTIIRTSWVNGRSGDNMVKTILRLAAEHDTLTFVDDQRGHPTFADDLAGMIVELVEREVTGVFHATNQGVVSWYEFARETLRAAGLDPARVVPISTGDLDPPRPAPRPANSVLENAALRAAVIPLLPDFREPLARLVAELT
jgi:dTDP-4-dehydrorhamnose reductase